MADEGFVQYRWQCSCGWGLQVDPGEIAVLRTPVCPICHVPAREQSHFAFFPPVFAKLTISASIPKEVPHEVVGL